MKSNNWNKRRKKKIFFFFIHYVFWCQYVVFVVHSFIPLNMLLLQLYLSNLKVSNMRCTNACKLSVTTFNMFLSMWFFCRKNILFFVFRILCLKKHIYWLSYAVGIITKFTDCSYICKGTAYFFFTSD